MNVRQSSLFRKKVKRFTQAKKALLDNAVRDIMKYPDVGEQKKGDLKGVFVYKFKIINSEYLLAYRNSENHLELIMIGLHENYYRDLKSYIKNA